MKNSFSKERLWKILKIIIPIKMIFLCLMLAYEKKWIYFGDRPTLAQNENNSFQKPDPNSTTPTSIENREQKSVENNLAESQGNISPTKQASVDNLNESVTPQLKVDELTQKQNLQERRGYLEDLLTLPSLDIDKAKKDEIGRYLNLIETAKQQLADRQSLLELKNKQLLSLEHGIDDKLKSLDEEKQFFLNTLQREKEIKQERLKTLVELYEKMEPKKAAPILEKMDKDLVVALFKALKQKQVTKILESMTPEKSNELSEYFGRIGSAREYDLLKEMNISLRKAFEDCKGLPKEEST